jgi:glycosyltransferase involved in cell wall biosynthesis
VVDTETYQQVPPPIANFKKPSIYLAGTFWRRSPMTDAVRWVIREVMPFLRQQIPDIHFYILGTGSAQELSDVNDPSITIVGKLPSVLPYLCYVNLALVPLRFESGTRFKILEAGACGTPVVSTTLGAEGIPVTHEEDILIADEPKIFADSIIRLITDRDLAIRLAENLKKLVHEKYSIVSLANEGRIILDYLTCSSN